MARDIKPEAFTWALYRYTVHTTDNVVQPSIHTAASGTTTDASSKLVPSPNEKPLLLACVLILLLPHSPHLLLPAQHISQRVY